MYKIYDDCISKEIADKIEKTLLDRKYLWNYGNHTVHEEVPDPQMFHLLHMFNPIIGMRNGKSIVGEGKTTKSDFFYLVEDLLSEIKKNTDIELENKVLYKARSTILFPNAVGQKKESEIHIDFLDNQSTRINILYYANESDGDTILYEKDAKTIMKRISPKKGRFVLFSGDIPHCASSPTESYKRVVMNINFGSSKTFYRTLYDDQSTVW